MENQMMYRKFGKTGEMVSQLGFGAMRLPIIDGDYSKIDEVKATEMIYYAIDNGVNYIDTAWPYHNNDFTKPGESEVLIGKILKGEYREKVKIATKLPIFMAQNKEQMDEFLDAQLERLQTNCIDFYLIHGISKESWKKALEFDVFGFMDRAKASGKIKHMGFSFHDELPLFKEIVDAYDWDFCQMQYNYFDTDFQAGEEGLNYAYEKGLGISIMEPLRGGGLSMLGEEDLAIFENSGLSRNASENALKWLFNNEKISIVLSGMTLMEHVEKNIETAKSSKTNVLSREQLDGFKNVRDSIYKKIIVPCTNCGYCSVCPVGVAIPNNFTIINDKSMFNDPFAEAKYYGVLNEKQRASNCINCKKCETYCPQHIEISKELKKVVREYE